MISESGMRDGFIQLLTYFSERQHRVVVYRIFCRIFTRIFFSSTMLIFRNLSLRYKALRKSLQSWTWWNTRQSFFVTDKFMARQNICNAIEKLSTDCWVVVMLLEFSFCEHEGSKNLSPLFLDKIDILRRWSGAGPTEWSNVGGSSGICWSKRAFRNVRQWIQILRTLHQIKIIIFFSCWNRRWKYQTTKN